MGTINNGLLDGARRIAGKFRDLDIGGGLPGAPLGLRLRGATKSGPPASGTWRVGDTVTDRAGALWTCTAGGTPGTWSGTVIALAPSGDQTGAKDAAAVSAAASVLPAAGGIIRLAPTGTWYIECGQVSINASGVYIDASGCTINAVGSGDMIRMYDNSTYSTRTVHGGGLLGCPFIISDGSAGQNGWHAGDILGLRTTGWFLNFTGSGSRGCYWDNQWAISEQMDVDVYASNCATHFEWSQHPGSGNTFCYGSFERSRMRLRFSQNNAAFAMLKFSNGVYFGGSAAEVKGNAAGTNSGAVTTAVFYATGTSPSGSQDGTGAVSSNFADVPVDCNVELAGTWTYTPTTFKVDGSCYFGDLTGRLSFGQAGNNFTPTSAVVGFYGETDGDPNIVSQTTQPQLFLGPVSLGTYASAAALAGSGTISTAASWSPVAPTAGVTGIILQAGALDGQLVTVHNESAFSITFAAAATSNVAQGANDVIAAGQRITYQWSVNTTRWDRVSQAQFTAALPSGGFTSGTGTAQQNVTGLAATLGVGTWKVRGWFPYVGAGTVGSTQKFAFTFGGTAAAGSYIAWVNKAAAYSAPVVSSTVTTAITTATITSTVYVMEVTATVVVTAAGALQLTVQSTTSGDEVLIEGGAFLEATQID